VSLDAIHVALVGLSLLFSIAAFFYARAKGNSQEHNAKLTTLGEKMEQADREIFGRLNAVEIGLAQAAKRDDIDRLTASINAYSTAVASSIGKLEGKQEAVSHQVGLMNSYLMSTEIEGRPER
jgi:hypothetical protein